MINTKRNSWNIWKGIMKIIIEIWWKNQMGIIGLKLSRWRIISWRLLIAGSTSIIRLGVQLCKLKSHFARSFGNVNELRIKKIEMIAEPVAAMAIRGLLQGLATRSRENSIWQGYRQGCLQFVVFDSILEILIKLVETCTWAIWRGTMQFAADLNGASRFLHICRRLPGRLVSSYENLTRCRPGGQLMKWNSVVDTSHQIRCIRKIE